MNTSEKTTDTTNNKSFFENVFNEANSCIQCGYCLPACPTYASMGKESASPRGRIHLVKLAASGKIDLMRDLAEPIDLCLGCRACEIVCPVGVPYGHILESAKSEIQANRIKVSDTAGKWIRFILTRLFPYPGRLRWLGNLIWVWQKSGAADLIARTGWIEKWSKPMAQLERTLPKLPYPGKRLKFGGHILPQSLPKGRAAFFAGCVMDAVMYRTNELTIKLLASVGIEVVVTKGQKCCGALHAHQGMIEGAKELAKENIEAFEASDADWIVNNAGGCGAALSEYGQLLRDEPEWAERARVFSEKCRDISELLMQFGPLPFTGMKGITVTYQDSCHLRNVQKVEMEPRQLIRSVPGTNFVEMPGSDQCCGSGGIYNLIHFEESMYILDSKMEQTKKTEASVIISSNPGCILQLQAGIDRAGLTSRVRSLHLVEFLAEACGIQ